MDHTAGPGRLWVRLMKRHRVERDATVPCTRDDPEAALRELLPKLDLSQPVWLPRHPRRLGRICAEPRFLPEHFMEAVPFDYMEISYIFPEDEKKAARPARSALGRLTGPVHAHRLAAISLGGRCDGNELH